MNRYFWTVLSLTGVVVWLVGSYALPALGLTDRFVLVLPWSGQWLQRLVLVCLLGFVLVQLWLVGATFALRAAFTLSPPSSPAARWQLSLNAELFWTLLPLGMTLGLAWLGYETWLSLPAV